MQAQQAEAVLRDLRWAVESPTLCGNPPPHYNAFGSRSEALWDRLAHDAESLPIELWNRRRTPMGRYFESLIGFWLTQQPEVTQLEQNLPVQGKTGTLGELDLVFAVGGTAYHWELAVKLYLGIGDRLQSRQWLGPLARDRWDRKLGKLFEHQLHLPETPEARVILAERDMLPIESHALIKGYLFHPYADWLLGVRHAPDEVNVDHAHGWWIRRSEVEALPGVGWRFLDKPDWLAPARGEAVIQPGNLGDWLADHFAGEHSPPLLAAMDPRGRELHRGFVVPDDWGPGDRVA